MSVSTTFDMAAAQAVLKELYDGQTVTDMIYKRNPLLALIKKATDFEGKVYPQPIITAPSAGRSANFGVAQGNQTSFVAKEFMITRVRDYSIYSIDHETMLASQSNKGAFVKGIKTAGDLAWKAIENSLAGALFRSGTGSIGSIGTITTGVIALSNPGDVVQFEVNMAVQANATDGGGSPRAAVGYVIAIDRQLGNVTVSASLGGAPGTPSGWIAGDFLLVQGDNNAKLSGLAAWLPLVAPTSGDNFYGVDRSVDPVRLAGVRYDGSAQSVEEALIDAAAILDREGGEPSIAVTNPLSYAALEKSIGSKVYVEMKTEDARIGFKGLQIMTPSGPVTVLSDRSCQAKTAYLLDMASWELKSLGEAPQMLTYGNTELLRIASADAVEGRIGYYGNLCCNAPGHNAVVKLGA